MIFLDFLRWAVAVLIVVVTAILVKEKNRRKKKAVVNENKFASVKRKRLPSWWRPGTAVLIDMNNVRGALGFRFDMVEACALMTGLGPVGLFIDHGPRPCCIETAPGVLVLFAGKKNGPFATADDMIVSTVGRLAKDSTILTVITGDRGLARRCRFAALRSPQSRLRIIPSHQFATWLQEEFHNTENFDEDHPFTNARLKKKNQVDPWLDGIPTPAGQVHKKNSKSVLPDQTPEGTPSRVKMAAGLYIRIDAWHHLKNKKPVSTLDGNNILSSFASKQKISSCLFSNNKDEDRDHTTPRAPAWTHTLLKRHPWDSTRNHDNILPAVGSRRRRL